MNLTRISIAPLVLAAALLPRPGAAQITDGAGEISGRVVSAATGQPIEHAQVSLALPLAAAQNWTRQAVTDKDGRYTLTWLPAEKFSVTATADNYVAQTFRRPDETDPLLSEIVAVADGASVGSIDFTLDDAGSLHGSVVEPSGDTVGEGVPLAAVEPSADAKASKPYRVVMEARTDASGHFTLPGLAPGIYRICVNGPDGLGFGSSKAGIVYRQTWLGDASTYDQAQTVEVRAGDAGPDLRIVTPRLATHTLTVIPVWPPEASGSKPDSFDADVVGIGRGGNDVSKADGSITIALPPGKYQVTVHAVRKGQVVGKGEASVDVSEADASVHVKVVPVAVK